MRLPLWIIAISLLVIAICLVIRMLQNEGERESLEAPASPSRSDKPSAGNPNSAPGTRASRSRTSSTDRSVGTEPVTVESESSTPGELSIISSTPDSTSPIPGGFAPVALATNAAGEIVGRVTLHGKPPPETKIDLSKDSFCAQLHPDGLMTRTFVVSSNGGLADAIVFIQDPALKTPIPATTAPLEIHFTNCQIEPFISVAITGLVVNFQNDERVTHRVVTDLSPDGKGTAFTLRPGTNSHSLTLNTPTRNRDVRYPQAFVFGCLVHPWESTAIVPFDHPYVAVTDKDGRFRISNVPPGKYLLEAIHSGTGSNVVVHPILVSPGQIAAANFTLEAPRH